MSNKVPQKMFVCFEILFLFVVIRNCWCVVNDPKETPRLREPKYRLPLYKNNGKVNGYYH